MGRCLQPALFSGESFVVLPQSHACADFPVSAYVVCVLARCSAAAGLGVARIFLLPMQFFCQAGHAYWLADLLQGPARMSGSVVHGAPQPAGSTTCTA